MKKKRILVTGGTGFIGSHVIRALKAHGYTAVILTRNPALAAGLVAENTLIVQGDILSPRTLTRALRGCDAVIHLAADMYDADRAWHVNVQGAQNLVRAMKRQHIHRLINISSQSVKIQRQGVYARTKAASDMHIAGSGLAYTTLRLSFVYGHGSRGLFRTMMHAIGKLPIIPIIGDGTWRLHPLHADDAAELIVRTVPKSETHRQTYDVGSHLPVSLNLFIKEILHVLKVKKNIIHIPFMLGLWSSILLKAVFPKSPIAPDNILGSNQPVPFHPEPLSQLLRFTPRTYTQGLADIFGHTGKLRIGIVGMGKMGILHAALLTQLSKRYPIVLTGFVDTNIRLASTIRSLGLNGNFYRTAEHMIAASCVDAVFITSPTFSHAAAVKKLLSNHLHVFVEKPLTPTLKETSDLYSISRSSPSTIGIGYFFPFRPTFARFIELMAHLKHQTHEIDIRVLHGEVFGPKKGWLFSKKLSGGGVLMNPASHAVSVLIRTLGIPVAIQAASNRVYSTDIEDEITALLSYRGGIRVSLYASWSTPSTPIAQTVITARGTYGKITATGTTLSAKLTHALPEYKLKKGTSIVRESALLPKAHDGFILQHLAGGIGYYLQDEAFIRAALDNKQFIHNFELAYKTEKLIHDIYAAADHV